MTRRRTLPSALLVGLALTGCTTGSADKGGGSGGVVTLVLASPDTPGRPSSRDIEYFTEQVLATSGGRLRIETRWNAADGASSWDQVTAQQVIDGTVALGYIPARAWDRLGVTTLQALQAPFLITSDAALDAVVTDPVAEDMLAGLSEIGITGLALVPEGLRHPASFGEPLLEPADFAGFDIHAPRSDLTWEMLEALGARPLDPAGSENAGLLAEGAVDGAETSAAWLPGLLEEGAMTANLTPYGKADALVVNSEAFDALSAEQRGVLRRAAADTVGHSIRTRAPDADQLAAACGAGWRVVNATAEQQAAMAAATQPVLDRLAADETTRPFLARITDIVQASGSPPPVPACEAADVAAAPTEALGIYDGVWRFEVPYQDGVDAGLPEDEAAEELGEQTVTLDGGTFRWDWRSRNGAQTCEGTYRLDDGVLHFVAESQCGGRWEARPVLDGEEIRWTDVRTRNQDDPAVLVLRELLHGVPWRRIDDIQRAQPIPEGVYRWQVTEGELLAAGVEPGEAYTNAGVSTFTVRDGRWLHHIDGPDDSDDCSGPYEVRGSRIAFTVDPPACDVVDLVFSGRWEATDDGIRFTSVQPADAFGEAYWSLPWVRIG